MSGPRGALAAQSLTVLRGTQLLGVLPKTIERWITRGRVRTAFTGRHGYGSTAAHNPVLHLRRMLGGRVVDHYQASFDRVWTGTAAPGDIDGLIATFDG